MARRAPARVASLELPAAIRNPIFLVLALAAALLWTAARAAHAEASPDNVWVVEQISGSAFVARGDRQDVWSPLSGGEVLEQDRVVGTGPDGAIVLSHGQDELRVTANSIVTLAETSGTDGQTRLVQQFGRILLNVESRPGWKFQVETPYLTAVVKGTSFSVSVDPEGADVAVEHGIVGVSDRDGRNHADLTAGDRGRVSSVAGADLSVARADGATVVGRGIDSTDSASTSEGAASGDTGSSSDGSGNAGGKDKGKSSDASGGSDNGSNGKAKGKDKSDSSNNGDGKDKGDDGDTGNGNNGNGKSKGKGKGHDD
jgi:hypothetical protein